MNNMGIKTIQADEVSCQRCNETIIVRNWWQARKLGWTVPCDGLLHLCPKCSLIQKGVLLATAVPPEAIKKEGE